MEPLLSADLDKETRAKFIEKERHPAEELTPFSPEELREVETAFAERCKASAKKLALPASDAEIDFSNMKFEQSPYLVEYLFSRPWNFWSATFSCGANFGGATFLRSGYFNGATFSRVAGFNGASFSGVAGFDGATFSGGASFGGATFSGGASFGGATFSGGASFGEATFCGLVNFSNATFGRTTSFVNAEMKRETWFERARFRTDPPKFFGAKLHQGTVWRGIKDWPTPKNKDEAGRFVDAYACLKLEMDRLKKHEDELRFFNLEMQSRRVELGTWKGLFFAIYGALSDYGRSYLRPLVALFVVASIGAGAFWYFDARTSWEALGLSAPNTLSVFGFRKDFGLVLDDTPLAWLKILAAVQTILGAILLVLFGLGIRNTFRMK